MSSEPRYFRVGLFVLSGLFMFGSCAVILGGQDFLADTVEFETYFDESVQGLEVGSPVKLRGVKLGTVSYIGFAANEYAMNETERVAHADKVLVRMRLSPREGSLENLSSLIARGLRLQLSTQGLTGTAYVEADFVSPDQYRDLEVPWEAREMYVPSVPSTIERFSSAAERIFSRLEKVQVDKMVADLDELIVNVNGIVSEAPIGEISLETRALIADLRGATRDVRSVLGNTDVAKMGGTAQETLEALTTTLTRVQRVVESGRYDFELALENIRVASENLRALSETAREYPSLLVLGEPPPSPEPE